MKMRRFHSPATSPGIAIGNVYRLRRRGENIPRYWIPDKEVAKEIARFRRAIKISREQLAQIQAKMCRIQGQEQIKILDSHRLILQDEMFTESTMQQIRSSSVNVEWALDMILSQLKLSFLSVQEEYFRDRRQDLEYTGRRVMNNLLGVNEAPFAELPREGEFVFIVHDISPAEIVNLPRDRIVGFVMEAGGETSHTAIVARAFEIPALFGVKDILREVEDGEAIILDGMKGLVIVAPHAHELKRYRSVQKKYAALEQLLMQDIHLPTETKDGYEVQLEANMELLEEIPSALQHGAEGVGLYRTEFLFLNRLEEPSEEEQLENYRSILRQMKPKPVTIRTIDIGSDKLGIGREYDEEVNPALGMRAIRLCLKERSLFRTQLRALLQASTVGNLRILIPMVSHVEQIREVKHIISELRSELSKKKIRMSDEIPLGVMIEVPSAVLMAEELAAEVDFFSIGTNDLLQYSLAIDRTHELLSDLFTPYHPALFRLLKKTIEAANKIEIPVALCGELAADPLVMSVLIGLGIHSLSMNPISIPRAKKMLRSMRRDEAELLAEKVLQQATAHDVETLLRRELQLKAPSVLQQFGEFSTP